MGGSSPAPAPPPPPPDYSGQFAGLASGQNTIRSDIRAAENNLQNESRNLNREITSGFAAQDDRFDDIDYGIRDLNTGMNTGFTTVGNQLTDLGKNVDNTMKTYGDQMNTGFTNVNSAMNTGFGTLGNQVDTRFGELATGLDTSFGNLGNQVGTGFNAMGELVTSGNQALLQGQNEGFNSVNENVTNMGTNLGNQLTETSSNVLTGQANIADLVKQYGGNLDTYYAALAQGQSEAAARQAALQTGLDSFRGQYDKDINLANQQRGRITDAVLGGNTMLQDQIAQSSTANAQGVSNVANQLAGVRSSVDQNAAAATKDFASVAKMITTGFDDGSAQTANMKMEFADRLNTVRNVLQTQGDQIDAQTRENYSALVSSFDEQGALIASSADRSGNMVARALDNQGNLLMATFNQQGQRINQSALNINQMMKQMDAFGYAPGSNQAMGSLSGQQAGVYSGLVSPYATTR